MEEGEEAVADEGGQLPAPAEEEEEELTVDINPVTLLELAGNLGATHLFTQPRSEHDYDLVSVSQRRRKMQNIPPQFRMPGLEPEVPAQVADNNMPSASELARMDPAAVRVHQPVGVGQRMMPHRPSFGASDPSIRRGLPPQLNTPRLHQSPPQRIAPPQRIREPSFSETATPMQVTYRAADPPPHRAMDNSRPMNMGPAAAPRLKAMSPAEFSHLGPGPHGSAPMLVAGRGSRPVVRGKNGSQTIRVKKDDLFPDEEALPTTSSISSSIVYMSPRKVHFSESQQSNASPVYSMQPEPSNVHPMLTRSPERRLSSPIKSPQRMQPQPPPCIMEKVQQPPPSVPMSLPKAHIPAITEDPHPLPENIIDDTPEAPAPPPPAPVSRPPQGESHLPPNIAELAIQFMPKNDVPLVGAEREENVRERIAQIAQHLTSGFKPTPTQQPPVVAPQMGPLPPHKGIKSRNVRTMSSSSSGAAPVPPFLMPNANSRLPGTSPVRTNLDFNSHLKSYKIPSRSGNVSGSALARVNAESPGKKRGRPKKKSYVLEDDDDEEEEEEDVEEQQDNEDWEGEDWVTRCICGFEDSYGNMVECETCAVWQHYVCLGIPENAVIGKFYCEICNTGKELEISPDEARETMKRLLKAEKRKLSKSSSSKKHTSKKSPTPVQKPVPKKTPESAAKYFYSKRAKKLLQVCGVDKNAFHGKISSGCLKKMIVAPNVHGMVADMDIPQGTAVVEIIGTVCLPIDIEAESDSFYNQYVFIYDGLGEGTKDDRICIDARKPSSNEGRIVRRCCQPNSAIQHTNSGGQTDFVIVTREKVSNVTEITLPFDFGHKPMPKLCACFASNSPSNCLILRGGYVGPGHRLVPVKKETTPVVKKKQQKGMKEEPRATPTPAPEIIPKLGAKDEKSEEESVAGNNNQRNEQNRKRSKTSAATPTPRRGSDKEEVSKDGVEKKRTRVSENKTVAELQKMADAINYVPSSERNKPSREERKFHQMMSRYTKPKSLPKETEVKKEAKEESGRKRRLSSKSEDAPSTSTTETGKKKKPEPEVKDESDGASTSSVPPPSKKSREETDQGTVPMKKSLLARYEAESKETGIVKNTRPSERDAGEEEAANALAELHNGTSLNLRDEMVKGLGKVMDQFGKREFYCLPPDIQEEAKKRSASVRPVRARQPEKPFVSPMEKKPRSPEKAERNSRAKEAKQLVKEDKPEPVKKEVVKKDEKKEVVKKEEKKEVVTKEKPEVVKKEETPPPPPAPKRKAISIEEYKKRQQESGPSKEEPRETRKGFIPAMDEEDIAITTSLPPIPLPVLETKPQETKPLTPPPEFRPMATRRSPNVRPSTSSSFVSLAPRAPTSSSRSTRASASTSEETPKHQMSIADRLSVEFGVGTPSRRSNF